MTKKKLVDQTKDEYIEALEKMLTFTFERIAKSQNPEANLNWFVSRQARDWYIASKYKEVYEEIDETPEPREWIKETFKV